MFAISEKFQINEDGWFDLSRYGVYNRFYFNVRYFDENDDPVVPTSGIMEFNVSLYTLPKPSYVMMLTLPANDQRMALAYDADVSGVTGAPDNIVGAATYQILVSMYIRA